MKRKISMFLAIVMIMGTLFTGTVFASDISVTIDGVEQTYDVMPVIENGRTLVPMRAIFESLGATVSWDEATKTVFGIKDNTIVVLQIGNTNAHVNGVLNELDVPATILDSRTMVPVRFISESLGCSVAWNDATKTVIILTSKNKAE